MSSKYSKRRLVIGSQIRKSATILPFLESPPPTIFIKSRLKMQIKFWQKLKRILKILPTEFHPSKDNSTRRLLWEIQARKDRLRQACKSKIWKRKSNKIPPCHIKDPNKTGRKLRKIGSQRAHPISEIQNRNLPVRTPQCQEKTRLLKASSSICSCRSKKWHVWRPETHQGSPKVQIQLLQLSSIQALVAPWTNQRYIWVNRFSKALWKLSKINKKRHSKNKWIRPKRWSKEQAALEMHQISNRCHILWSIRAIHKPFKLP